MCNRIEKEPESDTQSEDSEDDSEDEVELESPVPGPFFPDTREEWTPGVGMPSFLYNGHVYYWTPRNLNVFAYLSALALWHIEEQGNYPEEERRSHLPVDIPISAEETLLRAPELRLRINLVEYVLLGHRPWWLHLLTGSVEPEIGGTEEPPIQTPQNTEVEDSNRQIGSGLRENPGITGPDAGLASGTPHRPPQGTDAREDSRDGVDVGEGAGLANVGGSGGNRRMLRPRSSIRAAVNADGSRRRNYA